MSEGGKPGFLESSVSTENRSLQTPHVFRERFCPFGVQNHSQQHFACSQHCSTAQTLEGISRHSKAIKHSALAAAGLFLPRNHHFSSDSCAMCSPSVYAAQFLSGLKQGREGQQALAKQSCFPALTRSARALQQCA